MWLTVEPDFGSRSIKGKEQLKLTARQDLTETISTALVNIPAWTFGFRGTMILY